MNIERDTRVQSICNISSKSHKRHWVGVGVGGGGLHLSPSSNTI